MCINRGMVRTGAGNMLGASRVHKHCQLRPVGKRHNVERVLGTIELGGPLGHSYSR